MKQLLFLFSESIGYYTQWLTISPTIPLRYMRDRFRFTLVSVSRQTGVNICSNNVVTVCTFVFESPTMSFSSFSLFFSYFIIFFLGFSWSNYFFESYHFCSINLDIGSGNMKENKRKTKEKPPTKDAAAVTIEHQTH